MKEKYFDLETITTQARGFLELVKPVRKKSANKIKTGHSALLVMDMQRYFLEPVSHAYIPSSDAILPNIASLQNIFLQAGRPVIQTRHLNTPENSGKMGDWWKNLMTGDNPLMEIIKVLGDKRVSVLEKSQYDAFYHTDLYTLLLNKGIEQVVITGVITHLCCETTARSAFMRGFDVFFVVDGTATLNREFHLASLRNLSHGFAVPVLTRDVEDCFLKNERDET